MRLLFYPALVITVLISELSMAQNSLTKLWETDSLFKVPESVLYDAENKVLYVANIDGTDPLGQ
jgi:hypothetical protein